MIEFIGEFIATTQLLSEVLGMKFVHGHPDMDGPIGQSLRSIIAWHEQGNHVYRDAELLKTRFMLKHLLELRAGDRSTFRRLRKALNRASSSDGYFGVRFEVNIAASLLRKNVVFTKQESPDFSVEEGRTAIECTSVRTTGDSKHGSDYMYKIESAIRAKVQKKYASTKTALFIDMTNIAYRSGQVDKEVLKERLAELDDFNSFGSVVLFCYVCTGSGSQIDSMYNRRDTSKIGADLKVFLDRHFPIGELAFFDYLIPSEG